MVEIWFCFEFQNCESELEIWIDFECRIGIFVQFLLLKFVNYVDCFLKVVKKNGKLKFFVFFELDEFVGWIEKNFGI